MALVLSPKPLIQNAIRLCRAAEISVRQARNPVTQALEAIENSKALIRRHPAVYHLIRDKEPFLVRAPRPPLAQRLSSDF